MHCFDDFLLSNIATYYRIGQILYSTTNLKRKHVLIWNFQPIQREVPCPLNKSGSWDVVRSEFRTEQNKHSNIHNTEKKKFHAPSPLINPPPRRCNFTCGYIPPPVHLTPHARRRATDATLTSPRARVRRRRLLTRSLRSGSRRHGRVALRCWRRGDEVSRRAGGGWMLACVGTRVLRR